MAEQPKAQQGAAAPESKKPDDTSAFKQQRMPAWQPVMSPPWVIAAFIILSLIFIPIGIVVIVVSDKIVEVKERYDHKQSCNTLGEGCELKLNVYIPEDMEPPVLMYYQLDNFYQNHRRYAKSRSDLQLAGELPDSGSLGDCDPFLFPGQYRGVPNMQVRLANNEWFNLADAPYNPCGLIAWSMFNDSFTLQTDQGANICNGTLFDGPGNPLAPQNCEKKGIAWPSDPGVKFTGAPTNQNSAADRPKYLGHQGILFLPNATPAEGEQYAANGWYVGEAGHKIPDATDQDLMVWMRLASLSTFRKLYRRVTQRLSKGLYTVVIQNRFPVSSFKGKKYFVLTTSSWLGGKNAVLGGLYIATGVICLLLGLAFLAKHFTTPRRVGM